MAIVGDIMIILSGGSFSNPLRVTGASLGLLLNILAIIWGEQKSFRIAGRSYAYTQIMMACFAFCGLLYVLSGSNLFGFEPTPRYTEIMVGTLVAIASLFSIIHRHKLAAMLFSLPPLFHFAQAWEVWTYRGEYDIYQIGAGISFLICAVAVRFFPQKNQQAHAAIE